MSEATERVEHIGPRFLDGELGFLSAVPYPLRARGWRVMPGRVVTMTRPTLHSLRLHPIPQTDLVSDSIAGATVSLAPADIDRTMAMVTKGPVPFGRVSVTSRSLNVISFMLEMAIEAHLSSA